MKRSFCAVFIIFLISCSNNKIEQDSKITPVQTELPKVIDKNGLLFLFENGLYIKVKNSNGKDFCQIYLSRVEKGIIVETSYFSGPLKNIEEVFVNNDSELTLVFDITKSSMEGGDIFTNNYEGEPLYEMRVKQSSREIYQQLTKRWPKEKWFVINGYEWKKFKK